MILNRHFKEDRLLFQPIKEKLKTTESQRRYARVYGDGSRNKPTGQWAWVNEPEKQNRKEYNSAKYVRGILRMWGGNIVVEGESDLILRAEKMVESAWNNVRADKPCVKFMMFPGFLETPTHLMTVHDFSLFTQISLHLQSQSPHHPFPEL